MCMLVCIYVVIYFRVWLVGVVVRMSEFFLDPPLVGKYKLKQI